MNYSLNFWTIIEDSPKPIAYGCKSYHELYLKLIELGVTGFITEFPENCFMTLKEHERTVSYDEKYQNLCEVR